MEYLYKVSFSFCIPYEEVIFLNSVTFYDPDTGQITGCLCCSESALQENIKDKHWIPGLSNPAQEYVNLKKMKICRRPLMDIKIQKNFLSNIPVNAKIEINKEIYELTDGEIVYETPIAGVYPVRIESFPYQDWEGEIIIENNP